MGILDKFSLSILNSLYKSTTFQMMYLSTLVVA